MMGKAHGIKEFTTNHTRSKSERVGDWAWITMNSGWDEWIEPMFKATLELLGFCERAL